MEMNIVPATQMITAEAARAESRVKLFELRQREASMLVTSTMIPKQYQGKENIGNVAIAIDMAERMNTSAFIIMQNLDIIHGKPSFSAKFQIAGVNATGRFSPIRFRFTGEKGKDTWGCIAFAKDLASDTLLESAEVTIEMAKKEGWYQKNGSKWQTMPELMLQYRSGAFFARVYAPDVTMGMLTTEENQDMKQADVTTSASPLDALIPAKEKKADPVKEPKEEKPDIKKTKASLEVLLKHRPKEFELSCQDLEIPFDSWSDAPDNLLVDLLAELN